MNEISISIDPETVLDELEISEVIEHYTTEVLIEELGAGGFLDETPTREIIEYIDTDCQWRNDFDADTLFKAIVGKISKDAINSAYNERMK